MLDRDTLVHTGYRLWAYATPDDSPYLHPTVALMRQEWDAPVQACPWHLDPAMNVCDLWWRPVEEQQPDPVCELCGDPTPARLVRRDPARGWDVRCPACWMVNEPAEPPSVYAILQPERLVRIDEMTTAERRALAETCTLAERSPYAGRVAPEA